MTITLLILTHLCLCIMTGCIVSIYKDYKAGDKNTCDMINRVRNAVCERLGGIVASIFCIVFAVAFTYICCTL